MGLARWGRGRREGEEVGVVQGSLSRSLLTLTLARPLREAESGAGERTWAGLAASFIFLFIFILILFVAG